MLSVCTIRNHRDVWSEMYIICDIKIDRMPLTNDFIIAFPFGRAEVCTRRFTGREWPKSVYRIVRYQHDDVHSIT
jgi:hypothetical protein